MLSLTQIITNKNKSVSALSKEQVVMLVFLRHLGCIFCKEALADLSKKEDDFNRHKIKVIFVHMASNEIADEYFSQYAFNDLEHVSDPNCKIYEQFELSKGTFSQLFGLSTWVRGYQLKKEGFPISANSVGDSFQMPGIFVIKDDEVKASYIHKKVSDKPDYDQLIKAFI